jgi:hypothetical protein
MSATPLAPNGVLATVSSVVRQTDGSQLVEGTPATLSDAYASFNLAVQNGVAVSAPATRSSTSAEEGIALDAAHLDAATTGGPNINLSDVALQCSGPDRPKFSIQADWSKVKADFLLDIYGPVIAFDFVADPSEFPYPSTNRFGASCGSKNLHFGRGLTA